MHISNSELDMAVHAEPHILFLTQMGLVSNVTSLATFLKHENDDFTNYSNIRKFSSLYLTYEGGLNYRSNKASFGLHELDSR